MIIIEYPNSHLIEREYIITTLFRNYLGVNCELEPQSGISVYNIKFGNKSIQIQDSFFNLLGRTESYVKRELIPDSIKYLDNQFTECRIPIIYGDEAFRIEQSMIYCGCDIFASSFFMLTRWEELVIKRSGTFQKVEENEMLAVKSGFWDLPVVDEYCLLLKNMLVYLGYSKFKKSQLRIKMTHDVDWCQLSSIAILVKNLKTLMQKAEYRKTAISLYRYMIYKTKSKNPFDSFNEIMDLCEEKNLKSTFYFKAVKEGELGFSYDIQSKAVQRMVKNVIKRGHLVGIHPSENTFINEISLIAEFSRLNSVTGSTIIEGRNHGLYYNQDSLQNLCKRGLKIDSGYGFQFRNGFRCGTCNDFFWFDVIQRNKLQIKEIPFTVMDTVYYRSYKNIEEYVENIVDLLKKVNKHRGVFCINWHSNLFNAINGKQTKKAYIFLLQMLDQYEYLDYNERFTS